MTCNQRKLVNFTEEQEKEGYRLEQEGDYVLVWHHDIQIALLRSSPDISKKVESVIKKRRKELREIEEKTGWKPRDSG